MRLCNTLHQITCRPPPPHTPVLITTFTFYLKSTLKTWRPGPKVTEQNRFCVWCCREVNADFNLKSRFKKRQQQQKRQSPLRTKALQVNGDIKLWLKKRPVHDVKGHCLRCSENLSVNKARCTAQWRAKHVFINMLVWCNIYCSKNKRTLKRIFYGYKFSRFDRNYRTDTFGLGLFLRKSLSEMQVGM